jgi:hypothetical protein
VCNAMSRLYTIYCKNLLIKSFNMSCFVFIVDCPYDKLLTVNISATVALYNEFHACFRC